MGLVQKIQPIRLSQVITFVILLLLSVGIAFINSLGGIKIGLLVLGLIIGIPLVVVLISNARIGFFMILLGSFIIAYIHRVSEGAVPALVLEVMMLLVFIGTIIRKIRSHETGVNFEYFKHPITIALIIYTLYIHLQLFNPNSTVLQGKLIGIRFSWYNVLGFIIALQVFDKIGHIKTFFKIILIVSFAAAMYGLSQKYIGLINYDHDYIYSSPERMALIVIWGQIRAWSFLNDPSNFGLLMAFSGLLCFMLALGPYTIKLRIGLLVCGSLMFLAMVASGTRTAFVMVAVGFAVFGMLTINNIKTIIFSVLVLLCLLGIYFGPFYSAPVERVRSAFKGNQDASMNVRTENRNRIQPYIQSHLIGGGLGTTGEVGKEIAPGHPLSGFPPDSGYLKVALEMGPLGLLLLLWLYYCASGTAIRHYFNVRNQEIQIFYSAILASFVALCVANMTQLATEMRPFDFFIFSYFAIIIRLKSFDSNKASSDVQS